MLVVGGGNDKLVLIVLVVGSALVGSLYYAISFRFGLLTSGYVNRLCVIVEYQEVTFVCCSINIHSCINMKGLVTMNLKFVNGVGQIS